MFVAWLQADKSGSYLRAARAGDAEKVSKYLRSSSVDVNTCNDVRKSSLSSDLYFPSQIDRIVLIICMGVDCGFMRTLFACLRG